MPTIQPNILTIGAYAAFAPISYVQNGQPAGRDIEFLRLFAQNQGVKIEVRFFEFDRLWERPGRDECDLAAAGIAPMPSRTAPGVVWSMPYFNVQRGLLIRLSDAPQLQGIADFIDRTIAVTRGSTAEHDVLSRKPASTKVAYYTDQHQALADLETGIIDAYATGDAGCHYLVETYSGRFSATDIHPFAMPETFAFAVRVASDIEAALNTFISEQRYRY
jgi:polar amino acid transport system substrate-binding protein